MKKIRFIFILFSLIFLSSCSTNDEDLTLINNIERPEINLDIQGVYTKKFEYNISESKEVDNLDKSEVFISKNVVQMDNFLVLDPIITSKFVNVNSFLSEKLGNVPENLKYPEEQMGTVYKFSNNISSVQEFLDIDGELISIYLGSIRKYDKTKDLSPEEVTEKYTEVEKLAQGNQGVKETNFGLAIGFRVRDNSVSNVTKHDLYTYYIKKSENEAYPTIIKTIGIVVPKSTGLWTISQETLSNDGEISNHRLSAYPSSTPRDERVNFIQDNVYRRLDYVNQDYLSVTNLSYSSRFVSESYSIFNIHELANKTPLTITNIAGNDGNQIYQNTYKENINLLFSSQTVDSLSTIPSETNIGVQRQRLGWKFISGVDQEVEGSNFSRVYRKFDLNINPIINIGRSPNSNITWRDILARRPDAIDASISPQNDFLIIQNDSTIELYPIYYNFIASKPLFAIQNVNNYEIVMSEWVSLENINNYYEEFLKLPNLNSYITYTE